MFVKMAENNEKVVNNTENSHLLKTVLLSCSYKIYVQNITSGEKKEE